MYVHSLFESSEHRVIKALSRKDSLGLHLMSKAVVEILFAPFPFPTVL